MQTSRPMRDQDIRAALRIRLGQELDSSTVLIDELGLCDGAARVDLAAVGTFVCGYEIKSDVDTLRRLAGQVESYGRALSQVTLVTCASHIENAVSYVPEWWGLMEAEWDGPLVRIHTLRDAADNPSLDPSAVAQFLWRAEALQLLEETGHARGVRSKRASQLLDRLSAVLAPHELARLVAQQIRARGDWRAAARPTSGGGQSRRAAKTLHSRARLTLRRIPL